MTQEDYVSYEVAKLLKEKGFNEQCRAAYTNYGKLFTIQIQQYVTNVLCSKGTLWDCTAPTIQMAMKWLREVHNLFIEISLSCDREDKNAKIFDASIFNVQNQRYKKLSNIQGYEEAVEAALKYCLKNLI